MRCEIWISFATIPVLLMKMKPKDNTQKKDWSGEQVRHSFCLNKMIILKLIAICLGLVSDKFPPFDIFADAQKETRIPI